MQSAAGDNEAEGFKGWLFLYCWPFRCSFQGSFLTSVTVLTCSAGFKDTARLWLRFTNAEYQILKFSNSWNHFKFSEISSIGQLDIIRNCEVLKTGVGQGAWKVWRLKPLSKQYRSWLAAIRSGNSRSCPENWTYRSSEVLPNQRRSTYESAPPVKRTSAYSCFEGDPTDKIRTSPPTARWKGARKHPLHERDIFLPSRSSITTRTTRFALQEKGTWWQLASRCCWNRARPWHASALVFFLVGLRTYQHPGICAHKHVTYIYK